MISCLKFSRYSRNFPCRSTGRTVIVITHNSALTAMADRVIRIKSGQAISNVVNEHPTPVEEIEW